MKHKRNIGRRRRFSIRGSQIVTTVSITMVLVVLGVVVLAGIVADRVTGDLRSGMGAVVIVDELASDGAADTLARTLKSAPYVGSLKYVSAEEVNAQWQKQLGDDELKDLFPFQAEYDLKVKSGWSSADSLKRIAERLRRLPAVYDVKVQTEIARNVNRTVSTVMLVLAVVASAMLVISFVLIYNTGSMAVHARRVVIHTMQYVGARPGFIRRPYVVRSMLAGVVAGVVASGLLAGLLAWTRTVSAGIFDAIGWASAGIVFAGLVGVGALVSALATVMAVNKYLRRSYEDVHRD